VGIEGVVFRPSEAGDDDEDDEGVDEHAGNAGGIGSVVPKEC
jgi:hypothetical protein